MTFSSSPSNIESKNFSISLSTLVFNKDISFSSGKNFFISILIFSFFEEGVYAPYSNGKGGRSFVLLFFIKISISFTTFILSINFSFSSVLFIIFLKKLFSKEKNLISDDLIFLPKSISMF